MFLKRISIKNFRNLNDVKIDIDNKLVVIIGENGQGKTNLLESIHFAGTGKSYRTKNHNELIKFNEESTIIFAEFLKDNLNKKVEILINNNGEKFIKVNGKVLDYSRRDYFDVSIVNFSPDDINIINGPPVVRRSFMNLFMSQISRLYRECLVSYNRIVSQRNRILGKNGNLELEVWTDKLIENGIWIIEARISFLLKFTEYFKQFFNLLSGAFGTKVFILYRSSIGFCKELSPKNFDGKILTKDMYRNKLNEVKNKEEMWQETIIGPHRDDIIFVLDNFDARKFSSRGEQRLLSLALKLAQYKIIEESLNETPIVLIDDVLSELDENKKGNFFKNIEKNSQIFIAGVDEKVFSTFNSKTSTKLKVKEGRVYS